MVSPSIGSVVLVKFPFSDLSNAKLRPALVIADAGRGDWVLCQITSKPYGDPRSIEIGEASFRSGHLPLTSYARPAKLFTAHAEIMTSIAGTLSGHTITTIVNAVIGVLREGLR